ncbi:MAG: Shedu immune nuclease family protein [Nanoarchaeota archaeon]
MLIKSTSSTSAEAPPITLRETTTTRLLFYPLIVENEKNPKASVKGTFRLQRKGKNEEWENYKDIDANKLKAGEWTQLQLHSEELFTLISELDKCYKIYEKLGIKSGTHTITITDENLGEVVDDLLKNREAIRKIIERSGSATLEEIIVGVAQSSNIPALVQAIKKLTTQDGEKLSSLVNIASLKRMTEAWENNKNNSREEFWQTLLKDNSWVLSHISPAPNIILKDKAYVGGKGIENQGGNYADFLYRNKITNNICIVEIKTPVAKIIGAKYRNNIYSISPELSGAVTQVCVMRDDLVKEFNNLSAASDTKFNSYNPRGFIIIGNAIDELNDLEKMKSFDIFRNELSNIEIITFDELFEKINLLVSLIENH